MALVFQGLITTALANPQTDALQTALQSVQEAKERVSNDLEIHRRTIRHADRAGHLQLVAILGAAGAAGTVAALLLPGLFSAPLPIRLLFVPVVGAAIGGVGWIITESRLSHSVNLAVELAVRNLRDLRSKIATWDALRSTNNDHLSSVQHLYQLWKEFDETMREPLSLVDLSAHSIISGTPDSQEAAVHLGLLEGRREILAQLQSVLDEFAAMPEEVGYADLHLINHDLDGRAVLQNSLTQAEAASSVHAKSFRERAVKIAKIENTVLGIATALGAFALVELLLNPTSFVFSAMVSAGVGATTVLTLNSISGSQQINLYSKRIEGQRLRAIELSNLYEQLKWLESIDRREIQNQESPYWETLNEVDDRYKALRGEQRIAVNTAEEFLKNSRLARRMRLQAAAELRKERAQILKWRLKFHRLKRAWQSSNPPTKVVSCLTVLQNMSREIR